MTDVLLRAAVPDDADGIAEVRVLGWRSAYRGIVPDPYLDAMSIADDAERMRGRLRLPDPDVHGWVADEEGRVVGFVFTGPARPPFDHPSAGEVYAIYVHPDSVRTGIGTALLRLAEDDLRARGFAAGSLWVLAGNHPARAFYEAAGWTADGAAQPFRVPGSGGVELPEVRYVRRLG